MEIRPILSALSRNKTGAFLIAAQIALTFAITINAAYVIRDRLATAARPSGVEDEDRVVAVRYTMTSVQNIDALQQRDLATLRGLPGVESAAITNQIPFGGGGWSGSFSVGNTRESPAVQAGMMFDNGDVLKTLGVKVIEGRYFTPDEVMVIDPETSRDTPPVVLLTAEMAKALFPGGESVLGKTIYLGNTADAPAVRVIGVIGLMETPWASVSEKHLYSVVFPQRLLQANNHYLLRLKPGALEQTKQAVLDALARNDPDRVVGRDGLASIAKMRAKRYRGEHAVAGLLIAVTAFLLIVTASGIVGMASLWVNLRRKQIGVRRALGATRGDIVRYFVTENLLITGSGVVAGVIAAQLLNATLVRQMSLPQLPWQGLAFGVVALVILGVGSVLGPAVRASRLSPALATRSV
jgi:putative ABC transport system permease protein